MGGHVTFVRDLVTFVGLLVPLECLDENLPDFSLSVVLGRVAENHSQHFGTHSAEPSLWLILLEVGLWRGEPIMGTGWRAG